MQPQTKQSIIAKVRESLARDPKRSAVLGGLCLLMLILWGRLLLNGPAQATASLIRRSVAAITESPAPTVHQAASNPVLDWLAQPKRAMQRNLFAINLDYFARASGKTKASDGQDDPTAITSDTDQAHQQQVLQENLQTQATKLKLQTTMMGTTPRAMINGNLVKEGDIVDGFAVIKIQPRKITVQQDNVTLEIEMP
jgi:hypothetical protein